MKTSAFSCAITSFPTKLLAFVQSFLYSLVAWLHCSAYLVRRHGVNTRWYFETLNKYFVNRIYANIKINRSTNFELVTELCWCWRWKCVIWNVQCACTWWKSNWKICHFCSRFNSINNHTFAPCIERNKTSLIIYSIVYVMYSRMLSQKKRLMLSSFMVKKYFFMKFKWHFGKFYWYATSFTMIAFIF